VRRAFGKRRKTLVNALRDGALPPAATLRALERVGIAARARAEELPAESFARLARALREAAE
jgi:16S rRNA A1518/A1519 N6-dimethyltransferase RsmA/KsgA/DIM1 with predicted DNA glycosylase/AP lyase activity